MTIYNGVSKNIINRLVTAFCNETENQSQLYNKRLSAVFWLAAAASAAKLSALDSPRFYLRWNASQALFLFAALTSGPLGGEKSEEAAGEWKQLETSAVVPHPPAQLMPFQMRRQFSQLRYHEGFCSHLGI